MKNLFGFIALIAAGVTAATAQVTIIQQWDFNDSLLSTTDGTNATFFSNQSNSDTNPTNGSTYTVNRLGGTSGDLLSPLNLNSAGTDLVTIQFTVASWNWTALDEFFGMRLRNSSGHVLASVQLRTFTTAAPQNVMRVQAFGYNSSSPTTPVFFNGGYAVGGWSGSSSITVGLTVDLDNETYTMWLGDPSDNGSSWLNRFASYTGSIPGISSQTIATMSWQLGQSAGTTTYVELDQAILSTAVPEPSTFALLSGLGVLGLVTYRRLNRR